MEDYIFSIVLCHNSAISRSLHIVVLNNFPITVFSLAISLLRLSIFSFALRSSLTRNSMFVICLPFWLLHYYYTIRRTTIQIELQNSIRIIFGVAKVLHYSVDSIISAIMFAFILFYIYLFNLRLQYTESVDY